MNIYIENQLRLQREIDRHFKEIAGITLLANTLWDEKQREDEATQAASAEVREQQARRAAGGDQVPHVWEHSIRELEATR